MKTALGSDLRPDAQTDALRRFVHRYTGEHCPQWVRTANRPFPVQFADDADWLAHTRFHVTRAGYLSEKYRFCESSPTWPYNPELRKAATR